ncbi:COR domain-containing protein [Mucilaginibacter angelicae]|uniref:COR domain-containing protein n=1 Tax=Mucilaginibacter angelicae TaxID=869718 RepID=A0ABV6L1M5_9SPHI
MNDIEVIRKISTELNIQLEEIDTYSWDNAGYVVNSEGRIEVLNLHSLRVKKLPKLIKELSELKILHIVGNQIATIRIIKDLTKLEILVIQANKIKNISIVKNLTSLRELFLSHNQISDLTPLTDLKHLETLAIESTNAIDCSPVSSIINLKELILGERELENPAFLSNCKKLKNLSIYSMAISEKELPADLYNYIQDFNLNCLTISGFQPLMVEKIAKLSQLEYLQINFSDLKDLKVISKLTQLKTLDLSYNDNLVDIEDLSKLTQLNELGLANTMIKDVNPINDLRFLKSLNLRGTPIIDLEPLLKLGMEFIYDENGEQLSPNSNEILISRCQNITNPPIEIAKQGNDAIQRYFKRVSEEGLDYIFEAKLILVGEGSAGKTSLQRRIINPEAVLPEGENRTRGIEVVDFEFGIDNQSKTVHIWDFGGQDVYYPVHRFFITENSVFVLLATTRQPFHNFDYWIPTIFQFGGKSPIIIGQTCHQGNTAPWNELDAYLSNPNFNIIKTSDTPYYRIDLVNNNSGLNIVKEVILNQIENLHHFGKGVPKSWLRIRALLISESKSKACIPFQIFIELCRKFNNFENIEDIEDCCRFFNDIGVILWYSQIEELKDWVILEPEWAMNAVYKIIDDAEIQGRNGLIYPSDFTRLWDNRLYEGKYSILKKLLINFKIAFPTKRSEGNYIIPARLNSIPNEAKWNLEKNHLRLEYKFEFMPRGIVNQLSAELSRYIDKHEVWNNAVNFVYDSNDTKSQIIEDSYNRTLFIVSKGVDARGMNILIMNSMRNIIDSYKGVKGEVYVKCPCNICQALENPTTFLYSKLVEWVLKRPDGSVTCNESGESLKMQELLYNSGLTIATKNENSQLRTKVVTIFLASSKELKEDREQFEIFINRENKELYKQNIFLKLELWEDFIDQMSITRLQDEYNLAAINSDIFVSLFWRKVGKYTAEEFNKVWHNFKLLRKPAIYTFFKNTPIRPDEIREEDINSIFKFSKELKELGHYPTNYENIEDLKFQFKSQLQKILQVMTQAKS